MSNSQYLSGKSPEKLSFQQTQKGAPIDLNLEAKEKQVQTLSQSMDVAIPQYVCIGNAINKASSSKLVATEPKTSQMTIFYGGKVLVFDAFPAEKVAEIILLTNKGSSAFVSTPIEESKVGNVAINSIASSSNVGCNLSRNHLQVQTIALATRASLNRFFEKRKERATAKAPYQQRNPSSSPTKHAKQINLNL